MNLVDGEPWLTPNTIPLHAQFWGGHVVRVHLQLLVEPGRREGHLSHSACYCKDSKPDAMMAHMERACPRVKPKRREALLKNGEKLSAGDLIQLSLKLAPPVVFLVL